MKQKWHLIHSILTSPFASPIFLRSLTSLNISQRAEKFTTAQFSIFTGSTNFYRQLNKNVKQQVQKIRTIKMKIQKKSNTLLLKFHLPFRGKNSSPLPVISCSNISVKRRSKISNISVKKRRKKISKQPDSEIMKEKATSMASKQIFYPWGWQYTTFNLGKFTTYWNSRRMKHLVVIIPTSYKCLQK